MAELQNDDVFILKSRYIGIKMKGYRHPIDAQNLTDKIAFELIHFHPKGYGLFKHFKEGWQDEFKTQILNLKVNLGGNLYDFKSAVTAFQNATGKDMFQATPYQLERYFPKLKLNKRNSIIDELS